MARRAHAACESGVVRMHRWYQSYKILRCYSVQLQTAISNHSKLVRGKPHGSGVSYPAYRHAAPSLGCCVVAS